MWTSKGGFDESDHSSVHRIFSVELTVLAGTLRNNSALHLLLVESVCLPCLITNIHAMCHQKKKHHDETRVQNPQSCVGLVVR